MLYFLLNAILCAYVIWDGRKRGVNHLWIWGIGTLFWSVATVPLYLASRPLLGRKGRSKSFGWTVAKYFAAIWAGVVIAAALGIMSGGLGDEASKTVGLTLLGIAFFLPTTSILTYGYWTGTERQKDRRGEQAGWGRYS